MHEGAGGSPTRHPPAIARARRSPTGTRLGLTVDGVVLILNRLRPEDNADLQLAGKVAAEIREQKIGRK